MKETAKDFSIHIATDFSDTPGPRHVGEGPHSGEEFRRRVLSPAFDRAAKAGSTLLVDLDGSEGYPTSFLEEAFGGLVRQFPDRDVMKTLAFKSTDEPFLIDEILRYIREASEAQG